MSAAIAVFNPDDRPDLTALERSELIAYFHKVFGFSLAAMSEAARVVHEMDRQNIPLDGLKLNGAVLTQLRRLGDGRLSPKVIGAFGGNRYHLDRIIGRLPLLDQERLAEGAPVAVFTGLPGASSSADDHRMVPVQDLAEDEVRQVFAFDHVRNLAEQRSWLETRRQRQAAPLPSRVGKFELDPEQGVVRFLGSRGDLIPAADLIAVAAILRK